MFSNCFLTSKCISLIVLEINGCHSNKLVCFCQKIGIPSILVARQRKLHVLYLLSIALLQNIANTLFDTVNEIKAQGGGYSNFFRIRRLGPSIYRSPQKNIRNFKHPKKIFEIFATQKNIPILYLDLKKRP